MNDDGEYVLIPCGHCESKATREHCANPQCHWIVCVDCRKVSDVKPVA